MESLGSCNGSLSGRQIIRSRDGRLLNFSDARLKLAANMYNDIVLTKNWKGTVCVPISIKNASMSLSRYTLRARVARSVDHSPPKKTEICP